MALLFPRVIKSCTFKMTSNSCSLKQKNLKRDTKERDTVVGYFITIELKMSQTQDNVTTLNQGQFDIILSSQTSFCVSVDCITNAF